MFEIIDNFLSEEDFLPIQKFMTGAYFPWYFNESTVYLGDDLHDWLEPHQEFDLCDFQFIHNFYMVNQEYGYPEVNSPHGQLLNPILKKLNNFSLIKAKANLRTIYKDNQDNHPIYYHRDYDIDCTTAIFYINTNNGYTIFKDTKQKVECVANRMVKFDSKLEHAGISSTDEKQRIVINFNYIEKKYG